MGVFWMSAAGMNCHKSPNETATNHRTNLPQTAEGLTKALKFWYNTAVMTNYKVRICDALLERKLRGVGAVLLEGPKW